MMLMYFGELPSFGVNYKLFVIRLQRNDEFVLIDPYLIELSK